MSSKTQVADVDNNFPFEITKPSSYPYSILSEEEFMTKLEVSRNHSRQGMIRDTDDFISDIKSKYSL